ncbi:MAG: pteridine reductase [Gammaproteobacteria bacterium]|nr:pteridine reductase [Gammaproteobacteria bacterium]
MSSATRSLSGRVALITGAAQRIGAEIARTLHAAGMDLLLHYRSSQQPALALQAELLAQRANSVQLLRGDLLLADTPERLISEAEGWQGRLDLLVNNASSFYPTPLERISAAQWDDLIGTNLKAPLFLARSAAPLLRASRGTIVNLVDIHAQRPLAGYPLYCIAKAGNAMMVKSLARELGPEVRVNGVAPGAILWPEEELGESAKASIIDRTTLKRAGEPRDIARTVLFLVRDADYISGQIIAVDGGRSVQQ